MKPDNFLTAKEYRKFLAGSSSFKITNVPVGAGRLGVIELIDKPAKENKYRNKIIKRDGKKFDSKKEYERFGILSLLEQQGKICGLECQVRFNIVVNGYRIGSYISDFSYHRDDVLVVEDVKSEATRKIQLYRWKKKLMKAVHGIDIIEV